MSVSLSIKGVPEAMVERLRRRAEGNHRSLQRELMAIVEAAVQQGPRPSARAEASPRLSGSGLRAAESEAVWQVSASTASDKLLEELDTIVSGSHFGEAPLLTRDQLHDRALAREIDFDGRQAESRTSPPRKSGESSAP